MPQYDNTNSGALFKNDRKENSNHPDYKGNINVDGREFWLSAWVREKDGKKYFRLALTPKDQPQDAPKPASGRVPTPTAKDDTSLPF